ncbi:kinase suppressor of Ras 1-like isoform X3 [Myxocyprinus asiaticus]|uniref:kinase suppressor of Ras 1-like isoform X3 n=1 Tax=Myxocyprinus asiaticus TaxID=70543 RepID=UPI002221C446|nr:kinase suppressor of Ras 1-like isoform X3 [Myxocyprinus asiaticus]
MPLKPCQCRGMDTSVSGSGGNMVTSDDVHLGGTDSRTVGMDALHQCELIQNLIEISISSLKGLRTKCAASNDLTQHEIRALEVKIVKYIRKQLEWKQSVPGSDRPLALDSYPHLTDWLYTINLRPELIEVPYAVPVKLSLDALLQMSSAQVEETMKRLGSSGEECSRITAALSCLKSATDTGGELRKEGIPWIAEPTQRDNSTSADQLTCSIRAPRPYSPSPISCTPLTPSAVPALRSCISVSALPSTDFPTVVHTRCDRLTDPFPPSPQLNSCTSGLLSTPPATPPSKRYGMLMLPRTPPAPPRKLLNLLPNITLTRSKSQSQLANRIEDPMPNKSGKKNNPLPNVQINGGGNVWEVSPSRSPLLSARSPCILPNTPTHPGDPTGVRNNVATHGSSPLIMRKDIGLDVTHRFSTKSWLSQMCQVCKKNMMFGVKCKHCKVKCHNKCTKEAPKCRISFSPFPNKIRRTESVPSGINDKVERPAESHQYGTLPKAINKKDHPQSLSHLDSSSNPSSTTSSTPSSPIPFSHTNPPSATPPPNHSPKGLVDSRFHFPAACYFQHRQQFIFPDVSNSIHSDGLYSMGETDHVDGNITQQSASQKEAVNEDCEEEQQGEEDDQDQGGSGNESEGDELDDLPSCRGYWKDHISRKASQTSVYLQEWDVPFEQLELGELIGKGRWGKVYRGRWHGEVAVRMLEIDGNNQEHLKLFKKEVMNYRQTRHENVVLFMGACMNPPHLAIITSFCKGRTLYSVVRDSKLDINKIRQIAQEIVKGMGYLHAKGIVHKDLKSKNVFYDSNKVVITDFGLFGMSGVVQEDRRENELKLPRGWIYYLAPEIVQKMGPGNQEDCLPFSNAADVYAFGTIWYELQAKNWPITNQPAEALIWLVGSGEGIRRLLAQKGTSLGKEVTEILTACWSFEAVDRPTFTLLSDLLERLPKLNRRLSHPGHFWKSEDAWHHHCLREHCSQGLGSRCPYMYKNDGLSTAATDNSLAASFKENN